MSGSNLRRADHQEGRSSATVNGDPEFLRRALENVLRNAIRYAPEGSAIEVNLESGHDQVRIGVRDYGPGVTEEAVPHLFEPFFRVDPARDPTTGNVGLGLAIARRAVLVHHGNITSAKCNSRTAHRYRTPEC